MATVEKEDFFPEIFLDAVDTRADRHRIGPTRANDDSLARFLFDLDSDKNDL